MRSSEETPMPAGVPRWLLSPTRQVVGVWNPLVKGHPILILGLISQRRQRIRQRRVLIPKAGERSRCFNRLLVHHHLLSCRLASNPHFLMVESLELKGDPGGSWLGRGFSAWRPVRSPINRGRQPILFYLQRVRGVRVHWSTPTRTSR
jgi:hypothetical protein